MSEPMTQSCPTSGDPLARLQALTEYARKNGLTKVQLDGVVVELGPEPRAPLASTSVEEAFEDEGPSDTELLLWSTTDAPPTQMEIREYYRAHPEAAPVEKPKRKHRRVNK